MNAICEKTVTQCGKRSDGGILLQAIGFMIVGGMAVVLWQDHGIFFMLMTLSFMTITVIHYLCREMLRLRQRVEELEHRKT